MLNKFCICLHLKAKEKSGEQSLIERSRWIYWTPAIRDSRLAYGGRVMGLALSFLEDAVKKNIEGHGI